MKYSQSILACSLAVFTTIASSCGSKSDLNIATVTGVVRYQGEPVHSASVIFIPENGPGADGYTDENGEFTLKTRYHKGAVVGPAKVTISAFRLMADGKTFEELSEEEIQKYYKPILPAKYSHPNTTDLTVVVEPGDKNHFEFDLTGG